MKNAYNSLIYKGVVVGRSGINVTDQCLLQSNS